MAFVKYKIGLIMVLLIFMISGCGNEKNDSEDKFISGVISIIQQALLLTHLISV